MNVYIPRRWRSSPLLSSHLSSVYGRSQMPSGCGGNTLGPPILKLSRPLSFKIGGPSVFPPQPEGIWDLPYNDDKWEESKGEDRHRRGMYTFIRRTAPYPTLLNFDATSREICTVRRVRTNTPLQALSALNDPAFFELAKALAQRVLKEAPSNDAKARATYG